MLLGLKPAPLVPSPVRLRREALGDGAHRRRRGSGRFARAAFC
ncbi:hypothetical protein HMPREF0972_02030 [Actinomyces sp. oral taxon 848 str. F0332]|nr:hypothetical protein HMPREF0972_02030 [Actinomyces sp. oral taxon 848 str. F0332]